MKRILGLLIAVLFLHGCTTQTYHAKFDMVKSQDGVPVAYSVYGGGETALVFIHGWGGDSGYWQNQVPYFSLDYKIITIDLAGHGDSGTERNEYTPESFAGDIKSVVEEQNLKNVILIGHSMSGYIIAYAANLMPDRVIGVIGVDTIHNVEHKFTRQQADDFIKPFEDNFVQQTDSFIRNMFPEDANTDLVDKVAKDISSGPKEVGVSALKNYVDQFVTGESIQVFEKVNVPVWVVNADLWKTETEFNKKHIKNFNVIMIDGTGHFPMLENPDEFNRLLDKAVSKIKR